MRSRRKFMAWNRQQEDVFFQRLQDWENRVFEAYQSTVKDPNFDAVKSQSINLKAILDAIPYKQRERFMRQYRQIIGFDKIVNHPASVFRELKEGKSPVRQLLVHPSQLQGEESHPLAFIYNRIFVQGEGTDRSPYHMGKNILRTQYLRELMNDVTGSSRLAGNKRVMVFDTETTGLPYGSVKGAGQHFPDIRQISAAIMDTDAAGDLTTPSMVFDEHFRTSRMQLGHLAISGRSRRMDKVIEGTMMGGKAFANRVPGSGDDFVAALKPFLQQIIESDYIVGQNIQFDIDQVFGGLSRTTAYLSNESGFRDLLDQARESVMKHGKIKDTLEMARVQLSDIDIAKEIKFAGNRATRHSLENLMLQTNLPDLLRKDIGDQKLLSMLGAIKGAGTMHSAEVDTQIEAYLFKYLTERRIVAGTAKMDAVGRQIRQAVLKSYAPTPLSNIADISHIDKRLFEAMLAEADGSVRIMDSAGMDMDLSRAPADEVYSLLTRRNAPHASFRVTPLEQEIFATRKILESAEVEDAALALRLGNFKRWAQQDVAYEGFLNKFGSLFRRGERPSDFSYGRLQDRLAERGIPFAGLSMPERWLTTALASNSVLEGPVASLIGGTLEAKVASVADDLGISRFALWDEAYISRSRGRNITLPIELLQAAEAEGILSSTLSAIRPLGEEVQMLSLSAFETGEKKMVNLVYNFASEDEVSNFATWLASKKLSDTVGGKRFSQFGFTPELQQEIVRHLPTSGLENGIAIARMGGKAGEESYRVLESFYQGLLRDTDKIPMRVGFIGAEGGIARVGAAILDRFMTSDQRQAYARDLLLASQKQEGLEQVFTSSSMVNAAEVAAKSGSSEVVENALYAYNAVKKKLPVVGAAAGLLLGGYYIGKSIHEQNNYDVAMEKMSYESQRDYDRYRESMDLPRAEARRVIDPMATAGMVGNMHRNKVGHTQMGPDKYSDLYVGVI